MKIALSIITAYMTGQRKPFWERGIQNILFTMAELKKNNHYLDFSNVILIGHSNGGDISMMFASCHPDLVRKIISLDSLRYPFPADKGVPILYFGSNDRKADPGVIPDKGVGKIIIEGVKHIDLCDRGGPRINEEILKSITHFLE